MKKEQLYEVLGNIDESYINNAKKDSKKKTIFNFKKPMLLKYGAIAACFSLMLIVTIFLLDGKFGSFIKDPKYGYTISHVGWSDNILLEEGAFNSELLNDEENIHLPIFKIETFDELTQFKTDFENIILMDQSYDNVLSFNQAMSKAQWDREVFYENNSLLIIYVKTYSGSVKPVIDKINTQDESLCVYINQVSKSDVGSDDLAGWFVIIEIEDEEINKFESFDSILNEK